MRKRRKRRRRKRKKRRRRKRRRGTGARLRHCDKIVVKRKIGKGTEKGKKMK